MTARDNSQDVRSGALAGWIGLAESSTVTLASLAAMLRPRESTHLAAGGIVSARLESRRALGQRSAGGCEPVWSHAGHRPWCAIDGRPRWSDRGLADIARADGNAAALAAGFARYDVDVVRLVAGTFRLAVVESRRMLLAVDRVASLPLYVASPVDGSLVFASSLTGLAAHPQVPQVVSAQAIAEYLHFNVLHGGRTIFAGIEKLQPAHHLVLHDGCIERRKYWHVPYAARRRCSVNEEQEMRAGLRRVLRASVQRETAEVRGPIGVFLSGGLDSSAVLGLVTEEAGRSVDSFTVRFDVPGYDESAYASVAAQRFGAREHVYTVTPADMADALDWVARAFDEPFGNASAAGAGHCAALARQVSVSTMFSGDGGDELFAGGEIYVLMEKLEMFRQLPALVRAAVEQMLERFPGAAAVAPLLRARSYVRRAGIPMPARRRSYDYLSAATRDEVFAPGFLSGIELSTTAKAMEQTYASALGADTLQRHLHFAMHTVIVDSDLPKMRRICESHGIDARFPLLDDEVVSYVAGVPSNVLVKHWQERAFYRDALRGFLPDAIIEKRKQCFSHPLGAWLSEPTPLRRAVADTLDSFARRGIVRADLLDRLRADPTLASRMGITSLVWSMCVLERWLAARGLDCWS